ncbi:ATP synthase subunit I [Chamaesiphon polymorphus]|uniref:ATP synthase subunit I n=1 Tax=Chamaesiphon polymorphus CCALA 037 TaxID=2107692 RepID=A0A2T1GGU0_9CYAN|nr:ATP synthase subunit I [Chamaesiphon polymorphus]PSB56727.1 ATP synthase subunit I [Chamaesiphon polymorphus CCALA 037]
MNSTDETPQPTELVGKETTPAQASVTQSSEDSMGEYQQLKRELYLITLAITAVAFVTVAFVYELRVALNYLLGAVAGVVYLRLLAKDVDRIGNETSKLSLNRMALFVGLMLVAAKWHQLQILPVFLGFLTYKVALLIYILRTIWLDNKPS